MEDTFSQFVYTGDDVLDVMSQFAKRRNRAVEQLIAKHLRLDVSTENEPLKILEFGAGKGEFINRFIPHKNLETWVVELDDVYRKELAQHHKTFKDITEVPDNHLDGIFLIDVLEHLEDDRMFLRQFHQKLKPGGRLFVYVPARMELFSAFDKKIGHVRRYHKGELRKKALEAGFAIEILRYHEILGYFAAWFNTLFSKANDGKLNARAVAIYDRFLVPTTHWIERRIVPPIGKSLYIGMEKRERGEIRRRGGA